MHVYVYMYIAASLQVLRVGSLSAGALLNDSFKEYQVCFAACCIVLCLIIIICFREKRVIRLMSLFVTSKISLLML